MLPAGRSITSRLGSPRLNTRWGVPRLLRRARPWPAGRATRPSWRSWVCSSGPLRRSSTSSLPSWRTRAGASRSSTTRRLAPWLELRTCSSWAGARLSRSWLPSASTPTPRARSRGRASRAASSARACCSAGATFNPWPNHSRSRVPSGRERLLTPSWFWSTSRGSQSCWGGWPLAPIQRHRACWLRPLISRLLPSWLRGAGVPRLAKRGWRGAASAVCQPHAIGLARLLTIRVTRAAVAFAWGMAAGGADEAWVPGR